MYKVSQYNDYFCRDLSTVKYITHTAGKLLSPDADSVAAIKRSEITTKIAFMLKRN